MIKPKIIVADIDNTLVVKHEEFSDETIECINKIKSNGILFGVASGRPYNDLEVMVQRWKERGVTNNFLIMSNGCEIMDCDDNDKTYTFNYMSCEQIKQSIDYMRRFKCNPGVSLENDLCWGYYDEFIEVAEKCIGKKCRICQSEDYHEMWQYPVGKIMFRMEPKLVYEVEEYYNAHKPEGLKGVKTAEGLFEFTDDKASKGDAFKRYCKLKNIDIKDTWAFGDTSNDNDMLQVAGVGVCLLNGTQDTKDVADYITEYDCAHSGFAKFIDKYLDLK